MTELLFDHITFREDSLDTGRSLWFVCDVYDVEALGENAVCIARGAEGFETVLPACREFFQKFPSVFLALADDSVREIVLEAFDEYIPDVTVLMPTKGAFRGHHNVREVLLAGGAEAVDRLMIGAVERPRKGLLDVADIEAIYQNSVPSVQSGFRELDRAIGGFYSSELSVWTGKRGGGKSTLIGQLLLEAIDQGQRVCAYSGELSAWRFKQWVLLQAAGMDHIERRVDRFSDQEYYMVPKFVQDKIDEWWRGSFFLYDNTSPGGNDEDAIISTFEYAVRRFGCSVFLVDNMMTARFSTSRESDFYRAQSNFVGRLVEFAKKYEVHVHLVAHPRKTDGRTLTNDDIGGSGDVTNRADNVFSLERLSEADAAQKGYNTVLRVLKNRACGRELALALCFDGASRRFYRPGKVRKYGWESMEQEEIGEIGVSDDIPKEFLN